jgi:hypothetical protein
MSLEANGLFESLVTTALHLPPTRRGGFESD